MGIGGSSKTIQESKRKSIVYTVEECSACGLKTKRAFQLNDYVFKEGSSCARCAQKSLIIMVYAEPLEQ